MSPIKIIINGAAGRMGRRLLALAAQNSQIELVGALDYPAHPLQGQPIAQLDNEISSTLNLTADFAAIFTPPSSAQYVMIDFSTPAITVERARAAAMKNCALVIGTTGLTAEQEKVIHEVAQKIPLIHAANYSLGVNLLLKVVGEVAARLGDDFDIEISETHHRRKVDAPSGTALALAKSICAATARPYPETLQHGRFGNVGARPPREIGMHALRIGSVIGDHTVTLGSEAERLEFTHRAQNRDVFAYGALRAAQWLAGKPAGIYTMSDVLA